MRRIAGIASAFMLLATSAGAQDEMALQRCIWACLANSTGNTDPAYHACVEARCVGGAAPAASPPAAPDAPPASRWQTGVPVPNAREASVAARDGLQRLGYICQQGAGGALKLAGSPIADTLQVAQTAGQVRLTLAVNGTEFHVLSFVAYEGALQAVIAPDAPPIGALMRGSWVKVQTGAGQSLGVFDLGGSSRAIAAAQEFCYG